MPRLKMLRASILSLLTVVHGGSETCSGWRMSCDDGSVRSGCSGAPLDASPPGTTCKIAMVNDVRGVEKVVSPAASVTHASAPTRSAVHPAAWVTLLSGNALNTSQMVMVQALSVKRHSAYPHYTLVTPDVAAATRSALSAVGSTVLPVQPISAHPASRISMEFWSSVFDKLHVFNLSSQAAQVAYIDMDAFLTSPNADRVFAACHAEFCFVRDANPVPGSRLPMINAGTMVVRPSTARYADLLARLAVAPPTAFFPEQEFLTHYFKAAKSHAARGGATWQEAAQELDRTFNTCSGDFSRVYDGEIVHACGQHKLDYLPLCAWAPPAGVAPPLACTKSSVLEFQRLLVEVNPCVARDNVSCARLTAGDERCSWCGDDLGCAPSSRPCYADTAATGAALRRRLNAGYSYGYYAALDPPSPPAPPAPPPSPPAPPSLPPSPSPPPARPGWESAAQRTYPERPTYPAGYPYAAGHADCTNNQLVGCVSNPMGYRIGALGAAYPHAPAKSCADADRVGCLLKPAMPPVPIGMGPHEVSLINFAERAVNNDHYTDSLAMAAMSYETSRDTTVGDFDGDGGAPRYSCADRCTRARLQHARALAARERACSTRARLQHARACLHTRACNPTESLALA